MINNDRFLFQVRLTKEYLEKLKAMKKESKYCWRVFIEELVDNFERRKTNTETVRTWIKKD